MSKTAKWITLLLGSILVAGMAVIGISAFGVLNANAQVANPAISGDAIYSDEDSEFTHGRGDREPTGLPGMDEYLAQALNISVEELQKAKEEARQKALEQALEDGKLTQEQVEMMEARDALKNYIGRDALMAKALGIDTSKLEEALANGKRIPELLEEFGVDPEEFRESMQVAFEDAVQQAVSDGVITQEQVDQILNGGLDMGGHGHPFGHDEGKNFGPGGNPPQPIPEDSGLGDTDTSF